VSENRSDAPLIMLVEDEPDVLHTTEALLAHSGYAVVTASHPALAFELLDDRVPDLIVTDYMMPWMDGRTFAKQLKADPRTKGVPVVLLSAVPPEPGPWDAVLVKPAEFARLLATIRALLEARGRGT
jgi:CheY-like chemotaxis protein